MFRELAVIALIGFLYLLFVQPWLKKAGPVARVPKRH